MTHENTTQEDAISLLDIWCFLQRRYKVIGVVFLLVFGAIATYALTRPTMYEASANVQIGERFYFTKTAQSQSPLNFLIETPEQIKLLYSGQANINPIKNTRIVQIVAKKENAAEAQAAVQNVLAQIVAAHQAELDSKREEFIQLLGAARPMHRIWWKYLMWLPSLPVPASWAQSISTAWNMRACYTKRWAWVCLLPCFWLFAAQG